MEHPDRFLMNTIVALSIILVLIASVLAVFSVTGRRGSDTAGPVQVGDENGDQTDSSGDDPTPAGPGARPYEGNRLEVDDAQFPLSVGCLPGSQGAGSYFIVITNHGRQVTDYLVAAELRSSRGEIAESMTDVEALAPGEEREIAVVPDRRLNSIADCEITGIQGERLVLLTNR